MNQLTLGQQLMGVTLNPANNTKADVAKRLMAEAADMLFEDFNERLQSGTLSQQSLYATIHNHALGQVLNAQMNIVKVLTFK